MKAQSPGLIRLPPVQIAPSSSGGIYTNPKAPEIRQAGQDLLESLSDASTGSIVPLSLSNVELSASCIAAILVPALNGILDGKYEGRFVTCLDPQGQNAWDADAALKKESEQANKKLVCVIVGKNDSVDLIGPVDEHVKSTFEFAEERHDGFTARDLADYCRITIQAAGNRIAKVAALGLLFSSRREPVAGGGTQSFFVPID